MTERLNSHSEQKNQLSQIEKQAEEIKKQCLFEVPANMEDDFKAMILGYFQKITPLTSARQKESIKNNQNPESYDNLYRNIATNFINKKYTKLNLEQNPRFEASRVFDKKLKLSKADLAEISLSLNVLGQTLLDSGPDPEYLQILENTIDSKLNSKERPQLLDTVFKYVVESKAEFLYCQGKNPDLKALQAQTLLESLNHQETKQLLDKLLQKGDTESLQKFSQIAVYSSFPTPVAFKLIRKYKDKPAIANLENQINKNIYQAQQQRSILLNSQTSSIKKQTKSTLKYTSSFWKKTSKNRLFLGTAYIWGLLTAGINAIIGLTTAINDKSSSKTILNSALLTALGSGVAYGAGQALAGRENPFQDLLQKAIETFGYSKSDIDSMKSIQLNRLSSSIINKSDSKKIPLFANDEFLEVLMDKDSNFSKTIEADAPQTLEKFVQKLNSKNPKLATYFRQNYLKQSLPKEQRPDPLVTLLELYTLQKSFSHSEGGLVIQSRGQFLKNFAKPNQMDEEDFPELSFD